MNGDILSVGLSVLPHLLENMFDRKRMSANLNPNPNSNPNLNPKAQ